MQTVTRAKKIQTAFKGIYSNVKKGAHEASMIVQTKSHHP